MKRLAVALFAASCLGNTSAFAAEFNTGTEHCRSVTDGKVAAYVLVYIAGSMRTIRDDSFDIADIENKANKLAAFCTRYPEDKLSEALDLLFIMTDEFPARSSSKLD